jgi:riboflavin synthase
VDGARVFTGLIAAVGEIAGAEHSEHGLRLRILSGLSGELREGDSVSVDGVCLTVVALAEDAFEVDVIAETLRLSSLAEVAAGRRVNLELALRPSDRLGGHIVQGHVDGVGRIESLAAEGFSRRMRIAAPEQVLRYVVHKGSVAVNGVSLTVSALDRRSFTVSLIPETLERTNLGSAEPGAAVNLEVDVLAKYVERLVAR